MLSLQERQHILQNIDRNLTHFCPGGDFIVQNEQVEGLLPLLGVNGGDEHAVGLLAHHLPGGQVDDGHQGLADQVLGLVPLGDARQNLPVCAGG